MHRFISILVLLVVASASAQAQYNRRSNDNTLGGLLGAIVQASKKSHAQQAWQALIPDMQACMNRGLSLRGNSSAILAEQGISPDDPRLSQLSARCQELTGRILRSDFECSISVAGVLTPSRCNETYAEGTGSQTRSIRREQYILEGLRGENVSILQVETLEAMNARSSREAAQQAAADAVQRAQQAAADAAQKAQQAAADAAAKKQEDAARQKQAAADAALHQAMTKRDHDILVGRNSCAAKSQNNSFARMFTNNSDHLVLTTLLNTNSPPLQAYQSAISWLPNATDKVPILTALHDRIDYDVKGWGETISRSGGGNYSWNNLKGALDAFASNCLWRQYDQLALGSAKSMSSQAIAIAIGQAQPISAGDRISGVILAKIPSNQFH